MLRIVKVCACVGKCVDMAMRAQDLRLCIHRIAYKTLHTFSQRCTQKRPAPKNDKTTLDNQNIK